MADNNPELPRLQTAREISTQTTLSTARVYQLVREGKMPCIRLGRAIRFDANAVAAWLANGGTPAGDQ